MNINADEILIVIIVILSLIIFYKIYNGGLVNVKPIKGKHSKSSTGAPPQCIRRGGNPPDKLGWTPERNELMHCIGQCYDEHSIVTDPDGFKGCMARVKKDHPDELEMLFKEYAGIPGDILGLLAIISHLQHEGLLPQTWGG